MKIGGCASFFLGWVVAVVAVVAVVVVVVVSSSSPFRTRVTMV